MEILCSSSKIKLTFGTGSEFAGRSLRMSGEALCGKQKQGEIT